MIIDYDAEGVRSIVHDGALLSLEQRRDVARVIPSPNPESRLFSVEMTSGQVFDVELRVEVTEA